MAKRRLFSDAEIQRLRTLFKEFDADNSGSISPQEAKECLRKFGLKLNDEQVSVLIDKVDSNKSGTIEFVEFMKLCNTALVATCENEEREEAEKKKREEEEKKGKEEEEKKVKEEEEKKKKEEEEKKKKEEEEKKKKEEEEKKRKEEEEKKRKEEEEKKRKEEEEKKRKEAGKKRDEEEEARRRKEEEEARRRKEEEEARRRKEEEGRKVTTRSFTDATPLLAGSSSSSSSSSPPFSSTSSSSSSASSSASERGYASPSALGSYEAQRSRDEYGYEKKTKGPSNFGGLSREMQWCIVILVLVTILLTVVFSACTINKMGEVPAEEIGELEKAFSLSKN